MADKGDSAFNNPTVPSSGAASSHDNTQVGSTQQKQLPLEWTQLGGSKSNQTGASSNGSSNSDDGNDNDNRSPANRIHFPADVAEWDPSDTEIMSVGTAGQKITHIGNDFSRPARSNRKGDVDTDVPAVNPALKQLIFRSHLIKKMEGLEHLQELDLLELYDNQVDALECLDAGPGGAPGKTLRILDMSYNIIREMKPVSLCPNLRELYLANNKLKTMSGLKGLVNLRKIDLGANKIRVMDPDELSGLVNLEELWLGKNKIDKMQGLEHLKKLRRLDIQSNRLTVVENLTSQVGTLEELYLSHNGITNEDASEPTGLALQFSELSVLDLSRNRLTQTQPLAHLTCLEELWLSGNHIESFDDVQALAALGETLETVYLEYNPMQGKEPLYRKRVAELIPSLKQIDANLIGGTAMHGIPTAMPKRSGGILAAGSKPPGSGNSDPEQVARRLQDMVIARARAESKPVNDP